MNYHRFKQKVFVPLLVLPGLLMTSGTTLAQDSAVDTSILTEASNIAAQALIDASASQVKITQLSDEADELLNQYRTQSKQVDGLEVYNAGYRRTIAQQEETIAGYDVAISEAAELQRQIAPLMMRMMDALEQFVELDLPFQVEERKARLELVRSAFDQSDVNVAEKFRSVLQAYQIEDTYGRSLDAYSNVLEIGGVERDVDILKVGRVALLYQTKDQSTTGVWNKVTGQWDTLGDEYRRSVANGIRMANGDETTGILDLPISAPE